MVTVAIIIAISEGGSFAYNGLVSQAKQGAVTYAASNVYDSVAVYVRDGDPTTTACSAVDDYNRNSEADDIKVTLTVPSLGNPDGPGPVYIGQGETNNYNC